MGTAKMPRSLRAVSEVRVDEGADPHSGRKVTAVAGLIAVASFSGAEAQQSTLPPVTVDAPVARPRPAASKPSPDQIRARTALRRAARRAQPVPVAPVPFPNAGGLAADPYADPSAPYKGDRLAGGKFTEKLLDTPRTVTVLTREVLEDKNATSLRDAVRSTAGVTLGTGEGGNAFGDRFFIRGFDARNDVFVDGIRDPAVSIRENFFTEQVEILRGPASSFAGRGTAGGAINIVTKQAGDKNFTNIDTAFGTDATKRVTIDANQVLSPTVSVRAGGLFQDANVAGRNTTTDDRWGGFAAIKWTPVDAVKVTANYIHTDLNSIPDFGIPWDRAANKPSTETGIANRNNYYGFANRDFQHARQDIGSLNTEVALTPDVTFSNKMRLERSTLAYVGTLPEAPRAGIPGYLADPAGYGLVQLNAVSRYQTTDTIANQSDLKFKFDTGPIRHTTIVGAEISREKVDIDTFTGLTTESLPGGSTSIGSVIVPINNPYLTYSAFAQPTRANNPTVIKVDTNAGYAINTANYNDLVYLNTGIRYDDYNVSAGKPFATTTTFPQKADSGNVNWNVGLTLKPLPYGSVYAAYATSTNPVGAELDGTDARYGGFNLTGAYNQVFAPEKNKSAEVGTKWELFDRHLLLTGALFETTKSNAREQLTVAGTTQVVAGASYRIRGIDLGVAGKITDRWSVFGGLVLMESKVLNSATPAFIGRDLANIAHQSFNLMTKYKFDYGWELGGQATYQSQRTGGILYTTTTTVLPEFWRFDMFVEKKIDQNITLKLFVNNLTNKLYYDGFYNSAAPFVLVAPGRSGTLVLSGKF
ncbi:catecholate siderophore receptor [Tardiphaga sp. OK246]|jgi:catecholate siderophore receptor|uniref:TonB-dependent receptor n=1 Tax=Tardiphaga sp. OK246 TaxID=1855307 RepID=UPI000B6F0F5D|nr:TonB-dependent receptor [Tardiphaga sp. OK246]SNT60228.1 catecholate siderophore receptor [Tardiphaga sp. OK246]